MIRILGLVLALAGCVQQGEWTLARDNSKGEFIIATGLTLDNCAADARELQKQTDDEVVCIPRSRT